MQIPDTAKPERADITALFRCLSSGDRRRLLGFLHEQAPESLIRRELATYLVLGYDARSEALEADSPLQQVLQIPHHGHRPTLDADTAFQKALRILHHVHLPKLDDAGLIDRDTTQGLVTRADHPAFEDGGIIDVIDPDSETDDESLDALFSALADARRRTILDVLSHQFEAIHTETLARELAAREQGIAESEVSTDEVNEILGRLIHVSLPHLAKAGLIEYDPDARTVAYEGHPALRASWMHSVLEPAFRPSLTGESEPEGMDEIEGREQIISFARSLCDRANEELFCMITDTQLVEVGCLTRVRDAPERGVDVYLGTPDPTVREYVQEHAPEVVLWEPNTNWLNLPVAGDRVGRLLMADREAVMLGTLLEDEEGGFDTEQAIVGEGTHNTLVTMLCQLLSPHLDEIDGGATDIEARLPL